LPKETVRPDADGVDVACNLTFPVRPRLVRVTVELELFPARKIEGIGGVVVSRSSAETPIVTVEDLTKVPLVAVTVNV
jgi:hypothetical protein